MRFIFLFLMISVAWGASDSSQLPKLRRKIIDLQEEMSVLEGQMKRRQDEEILLQTGHKEAVAALVILEDSMRSKERQISDLHKELQQHLKLEREANSNPSYGIDSNQDLIEKAVSDLEASLHIFRNELRSIEADVLQQRDVIKGIVFQIESLRTDMSSLAGKARASGHQRLQISRKIKEVEQL